MRASLLVFAWAVGACTFSSAGVDEDEVVDAGELEVDGDTLVDAAVVDAVVVPMAPDAALNVCEKVPELVACYRFEVPSDRLRDESMYMNKGVAMNAVGELGPGSEGLAIGFGPGVTARVPDSASLDVPGDLSIEFWVRVDTFPAAGGRAGLVDNNGQYGIFLGPGGELRISIAGASLIGGALVLGEWTHVATVHETGKNLLFLNGTPVAEIGASGNPATAGVDGLALGQDSPMGDNLDGAMDTVKIWKKRRSNAEICQAAGRSDCP